MANVILFLLLISGVVLILYGLREYIDAGNIYNTFAVKNNIIGYGKAEGLYLIATENYYLVAGRKVRSKKKAIKEFFELINKNELLPPDMYFKVIRAKGTTLNKEIEQEGRDFAESLIKRAQKEREKELEKELEIKNNENIINNQKFIQTEQKTVKVKRR
ncbi:MAG: hypothetical protein EVJ46_06400 [Candidatus Acididesulfobacter guangdongensis]|uniref:Uncharacterized protein n=1 Tax=Acididesulfobacter guangdongensis TaxID=2597225 RepID=A0A519BH89_ACIG2|nr:MAG: hypothetical protein EVJ46_06400 [Candidatus Acididesulfobacter guangdongensis]